VQDIVTATATPTSVPTPHNAASIASLSLTVPPNGVGLAFAWVSTSGTPSLTNLTESTTPGGETIGSRRIFAMHTTGTGALTVGFGIGGNYTALAAAAWGP
jgi:hypothetical protein